MIKLIQIVWMLILISFTDNYLSSNEIEQRIFYYFAHGLRGNKDRYRASYFEGFFPAGTSTVISENGPDFIEEELSKSIELTKIKKMSFWKRISMRFYREFVLICALRRSVMAQQEDQNRVLNAIDEKLLETKNVIYVGHSKGAGIGANLLQYYQWKGVILISPFSHADQAFRDFPPISSFPKYTLVEKYLIPILRFLLLPKYDSKGQQPLDIKHDSPKSPVLIISVKNDDVVPQIHQKNLYNKLKANGYTVYYYELQSGTHGSLADNYPQEHERLISVVDAFRKYVVDQINSDLLQSPDVVE
jgi:predicted esterase